MSPSIACHRVQDWLSTSCVCVCVGGGGAQRQNCVRSQAKALKPLASFSFSFFRVHFSRGHFSLKSLYCLKMSCVGFLNC